MQEDFIARVLDMLQVGDLTSPEAVQDAEERAYGMQVAVSAFMRSRVGPGQALRLAAQSIDSVDDLKAGRPMVAVEPQSVIPFANLLLSFLRERRHDQPTQAAAGHCEAAAMILAGAAFLQERHGAVHMSGFLAGIAQEVQRVTAAGEHPLSAPAEAVSVLPPPDGAPNFSVTHRTGTTLKERITVMSDFLRSSSPADAQSDALASIMASSLFLRERFGESYAVEALRHVEGTVSQIAALDRWQPAEGARPN